MRRLMLLLAAALATSLGCAGVVLAQAVAPAPKPSEEMPSRIAT